MPPLIHIVRHGEALHNTHPNYPHRNPPLTKSGHYATKHKHLPAHPDLVLISPLTRTIQTALNMFPFLSSQSSTPSSPTTPIPAHIWPDLRETHDTSSCNQGSSRRDLEAKFPQFDFSSCREEWDYDGYSEVEAVARAERVRRRVKELVEGEEGYENVFLITHKGFKGYLVGGRRFGLAEVRTYRFVGEKEEEEEGREEGGRWRVDWETGVKRDYGPTVLMLEGGWGRSGRVK